MEHLKRTTLGTSVAACICLGLGAPLLAAEPPATGTAAQPSASAKSISATKPAQKCLSDLRAFDNQMEKDGHWLGAAGYGYGYPMGEIGYGYSYPMGGATAAAPRGYVDARPGYEVRILVASANILARHGQQAACENVLATTRSIYKLYVADMKSGDIPRADIPTGAIRRSPRRSRSPTRIARSGRTNCSATPYAACKISLSAASRTS